MHRVSIRPKKILQYISDVHIDTCTDADIPKIFNLVKPATGAKMLAVCGDVGLPTHPNTKLFFEHVASLYEKILFVPGNHDYGFSTFDADGYAEFTPKLSDLCSTFKNIYVLDNNTFVDDDTIFIGSTLWSNSIITETEENIEKFPLYIKNCNDHRKKHLDDLNWIKKTVEENRDKQIVMLTHYSPTIKLMEPAYVKKGKEFVSWYATDLEYLMTPPITHWLCGHVHFASKCTIGSTMCALNAGRYKLRHAYDDIEYIEY